MEVLISLFIFIFGLIVGSFLNCVIYRLYVKKGFLKGRSYCPQCKHLLTWRDLIPLLSFLVLKGKCQYCKRAISIQYPLVELATGTLFVTILNQQLAINSQQLIFLVFNTCFLFLVSCFLIVTFVYDLKHYIIPDRVIYPAIAVTFLYLISKIFYLEFVSGFKFQVSGFTTLLNSLLSAMLAAGFFLIIVLVSKGRWMGVGDIKLAFFMGLLLSFPNILVALFLAFFIGAIVGLMLIFSGKKTFKSEIPFGPFLVTGTFLAMLLGGTIIDFYLGLFLLK